MVFWSKKTTKWLFPAYYTNNEITFWDKTTFFSILYKKKVIFGTKSFFFSLLYNMNFSCFVRKNQFSFKTVFFPFFCIIWVWIDYRFVYVNSCKMKYIDISSIGYQAKIICYNWRHCGRYGLLLSLPSFPPPLQVTLCSCFYPRSLPFARVGLIYRPSTPTATGFASIWAQPWLDSFCWCWCVKVFGTSVSIWAEYYAYYIVRVIVRT
jgi:hypothetical protein